jgi:hypothetical protein
MVAPARTPLRVDRLRALNLPRRVEVELDAQGRPAAVMDEHRRAVETIGEVWRVDDEWWRQPINRRYFDVVLEGGKHVVLYQDLTTNQWWGQQP